MKVGQREGEVSRRPKEGERTVGPKEGESWEGLVGREERGWRYLGEDWRRVSEGRGQANESVRPGTTLNVSFGGGMVCERGEEGACGRWMSEARWREKAGEAVRVGRSEAGAD